MKKNKRQTMKGSDADPISFVDTYNERIGEIGVLPGKSPQRFFCPGTSWSDL